MLIIISGKNLICWLVEIGRSPEKRGKENLTKLKTELFAEPKENEEYTISSVEEITVKSEGKSYPSIKVSMVSQNAEDKTNYSLTLWLTDEASRTSKLGSFIDAFRDFFKGKEDANDTDTWLEHTIKILRWRNRDRDIEVTA